LGHRYCREYGKWVLPPEGKAVGAPLLQREADIVILRRSNVVLQNLQGERCRGDDDTIVELWQT
jgi:hypothetical protein